MKRPILLLSLVAGMISCVKDKPAPSEPETPAVITPAKQNVFILNEGNFGSGNASVTLYDPVSGTIVKDQYGAQNGAALGDVAQSMRKIGDKYYIVVNNSKKIVICDKDLKKTAEIGGLSSPRHILPLSSARAYVSDLSGAISVIDLNANIITGTIACSGGTEGMAVVNNEVFVASQARGMMYVINTGTDKITDSVSVGPYAANISADKNGKLWVLSQGESWKGVAGRLSKVDPATRKVELALPFASSDWPSALCMNKTKDTLLYLKGGIWRMPVTAAALPAAAFVPAGTKTFYGLGVNPADHRIYAADALDYIQSSVVYVYDSQGNNTTHFKAGILANSFYFE